MLTYILVGKTRVWSVGTWSTTRWCVATMATWVECTLWPNTLLWTSWPVVAETALSVSGTSGLGPRSTCWLDMTMSSPLSRLSSLNLSWFQAVMTTLPNCGTWLLASVSSQSPTTKRLSGICLFILQSTLFWLEQLTIWKCFNALRLNSCVIFQDIMLLLMLLPSILKGTWWSVLLTMVLFISGIGKVDTISSQYSPSHSQDLFQLKLESLMLFLITRDKSNTYFIIFILLNLFYSIYIVFFII